MSTYWTLSHFVAHSPGEGSCEHRHTTYTDARSCAKRLRRQDPRTCTVGVWTDECGTERLADDGSEGQEATG